MGIREVFLFLYFLFLFFTKIYFRFQNLQEYTPAAPLPGGQDLVAPLRGGRGFSVKNFAENLHRNPWRTGRPAAGRPPPPALYKGLVAPQPLICPTKNPEKKKRGGGRERRGEGEAKRRSPVGFSSRRLQVTKMFYTLLIDYVVIIFVDTVD